MQSRNREEGRPVWFSVYPFETRVQWLFRGPHHHYIRALESHGFQDSLVQDRLESLRRWGVWYSSFVILASMGLATTVLTAVATIIPPLDVGLDVFDGALGIVTAFGGFFALLAFFFSRLLQQIQADILMLLILK